MGGRINTILQFTDHINKKLVRKFLLATSQMHLIIGERVNNPSKMASLEDPFSPPSRIILLSKYRDSIYINLLNFAEDKFPFSEELLSRRDQ